MDQLTPWKDNPRFNAEAVPPLAELIKLHGFINPVVCTPDGTIRSGHTRFKALQFLRKLYPNDKRWRTITVQWMNFPTEAAANAYALADNKSAEWSDWDNAALARLFGKKRPVDPELFSKLSGFKRQEIEWGGKNLPDVDALRSDLDEMDDDFADDSEETYVIRVDGVSKEDRDEIMRLFAVVLRRARFSYEVKAY